MWVINLKPITEGVYRDHDSDNITSPPDGWAMIPEDMPLPSTFPRLGSLEAEEKTYAREVQVEKDGEITTETQEYTMMTVTSMTEGTLPDPAPEVPTQLDIIEAQVTYTALMTDTLLEV